MKFKIHFDQWKNKYDINYYSYNDPIINELIPENPKDAVLFNFPVKSNGVVACVISFIKVLFIFLTNVMSLMAFLQISPVSHDFKSSIKVLKRFI